jgi:hypothetical protein
MIWKGHSLWKVYIPSKYAKVAGFEFLTVVATEICIFWECHVVWWKLTSISDDNVISIFKNKEYTMQESNMKQSASRVWIFSPHGELNILVDTVQIVQEVSQSVGMVAR